MVIVYMIFLVAFLRDNRIRTEEDFQRYLGLSIFCEIPNADDSGKRGCGYYRYGKYKYGYGRRPYTSQAKAAVKEASTRAAQEKRNNSVNKKAGNSKNTNKPGKKAEKVSTGKEKNI